MPRPFSRLFFAFWDIANMHLCTKFQVSSSTGFGDGLGGTSKFMGVTWPRPRPFSRFSLRVFEILPLCICVSSVATGGLGWARALRPCWVMGFAQIRRVFWGEGIGEDATNLRRRAFHTANCLYLASGAWPNRPQTPTGAPPLDPDGSYFRAWLRHWSVYQISSLYLYSFWR